MEAFSFETLVLKPLLAMLIQLLQWLLQLFQLLNQNFFVVEIVRNILELFQYVMYGMYIIGVLFALIDFVTCYLDGYYPSLLSLSKHIGKGLFITLFMQRLMYLAYECIYYLSHYLFHFNESMKQLFDQNNLTKMFRFSESDTLIGIVIIIVLVTVFTMILFQLLERNGLFLLHQCMSVFYIIGVCRGKDDLFSMWIRQGIALCFINFVQILFFAVGLMLLNYPDVIFVAIGLLLVAIKMDKIIFSFILNKQMDVSRFAVLQSGTNAFSQSVN